jgi:hypothetical protein
MLRRNLINSWYVQIITATFLCSLLLILVCFLVLYKYMWFALLMCSFMVVRSTLLYKFVSDLAFCSCQFMYASV